VDKDVHKSFFQTAFAAVEINYGEVEAELAEFRSHSFRFAGDEGGHYFLLLYMAHFPSPAEGQPFLQ
jgi:hypothetical protein